MLKGVDLSIKRSSRNKVLEPLSRKNNPTTYLGTSERPDKHPDIINQ
jgi:hypothetical protein